MTTHEDLVSIYPLSPMQQGMLFHTLFAPEATAYCQQFACTLQGVLDISAFQKAWQTMLERHTILRSFFVWEKQKQPLQLVKKEVSLPFEAHDWRHLPATTHAQGLEDLMRAQREAGFDAKNAPLMRLTLIHLEDARTRFVWTFHHILLDGWSVPLLFREMFVCYEAYRSHRTPELPAAVPFQDYISWLGGRDKVAAAAYWQQTLSGFCEPTSPRVAQTVRAAGSADHRVILRGLSAEDTGGLERVARAHQLTLNTLVHAAWALLLAEYAGTSDVVFGSTTSGRPAELAGVTHMIGLFINTLPVRARLNDRTRLCDWARDLQVHLLEREAYAYSALIDIQGVSEIPRGVDLFESLLVFESFPFDPDLKQMAEGLVVSDLQSYERTHFPLVVTVVPGATMEIRLCAQSTRFDEETVEGIMGYFLRLLTRISRDPNAPLYSLRRPDPEKQSIIREPATPQPSAVYLHQRVVQIATQHPDRPAVTTLADQEETTMTYGELQVSAERICAHLRHRGIGPGDVVGVHLPRSSKLIGGLLGVLQAGAAYLPLESAYPEERLRYMVADAGADLVLTCQDLCDVWRAEAVPFLVLDTETGDAPERKAIAMPTTSGEDLCYLIYTSGSTGEPKGVAVSHGALSHYLAWSQTFFRVTAETVSPVHGSMSFDGTVNSIWTPLFAGGSLLLLPEGNEIEDLARIVFSGRPLGLLKMTPAHLDLLAIEAAHMPDARADVATVILGGEALRIEALANWRTLAPKACFFNQYGPTETTVGCCAHEVAPQQEAGPAPIGMPVKGVDLFVLDSHLRPCPVGIAGELFIGGSGVARGYHGRPALTAARFIPDPFSQIPGARLYRSGDLVRFQETLLFLGRIDRQITLRGTRVEPAEIETALRAHEHVAEAVVVPLADGRDPILAAYITRKDPDQPLSPMLVRRFVQERLPEFMVPATVTLLDEIPLTANGKVNRHTLPKPDMSTNRESYVAPRTPLEVALVEVWSEILGFTRVGIYDNFFELGGHSLVAIRLISRLRHILNVELSLRELFEFPVLHDLAQRIDTIRRGGKWEAQVIQPAPRDKPLPLSFSQQRVWFLQQLEPGTSAYNNTRPLNVWGPLKRDVLERALAKVVSRHEILRTVYRDHEGTPYQLPREEVDFKLEYHDLRDLPEEDRYPRAVALATEEAVFCFDLRTDIPIRVVMVTLNENRHIVIVNVHHIATDYWTRGVLTREGMVCYRAYLQGEEPVLDPPEIQYADYAVWQRNREQIISQQLKYWTRRLANAPALNLPQDHPRPAQFSFRGGKNMYKMNRELGGRIRSLGVRRSVTPFMLLLATFKILLARYTRQEDVLVGSPVANRSHREVEQVIGFFANTAVFRTDLSGNPTFDELLDRVRDTALGAYDHKELPFEDIVRALNPDRDLSINPIFQVLFVYEGEPLKKVDLPQLKFENLDVEKVTSKFDLSLMIWPSEEGFDGFIEFNSDIFESATIDRLWGHFLCLLEAAARSPKAPIYALPMLTAEEREQILVTWNRTASPYDSSVTVQAMFETCVARHADDIALVFEGAAITYAELNARANRMAHLLHARGVGQDQLVGVCTERTPHMIVAILAILKAGGAYLPLDPGYPRNRIGLMVQDAQLRWVLADQTGRDTLAEIHVDAIDVAADYDQPETNASFHCLPEHLAYVLYTSGSTGIPKGVAVEQRNVTHFIDWIADVFEQEDLNGVLAGTSINFDISVFEILGTLCRGGKMILVQDVPALAQLSDSGEHPVRLLNSVPSVVAELLRMGSLPASVEVVNVAGEAPARTLIDALYDHPNIRKVHNLYGPTEYTIYTTVREVSRDSDKEPPIGRPINNTELYILDAHMRPVPIGISGELYVTGAGLARGYLNRPELTAQRFIKNPFPAPMDGPVAYDRSRLYRTGDLARYLPNGTVQFMGRVDHQIKLRGFRIELGEIEAVLRMHEEVNDTIVILSQSSSGEGMLVAYLIAHGDHGSHGNTLATDAPLTHSLREHLQEGLPRHMVPSVFVLLDSLPLLGSGKVDRDALPQAQLVESSTAHVPPRSETEKRIAEIWCQVLGRDRVGVHDDFFKLGGHSLVATRVISHLQDSFQVKLPLRHLFEAPTLERLANAIDQALEQGPRPEISVKRLRRRVQHAKLNSSGELVLDAKS